MYFATYARYWWINVLTSFEYRANFLMWAAFTVIYHGTAIAALWVTLRNFPSINGWDFRQTAFMYGLWMLGHSLHNTLFISVGSVPEFIREGEHWDLLEARVSKTVDLEMVTETERPIPGVNITQTAVLRVRK